MVAFTNGPHGSDVVLEQAGLSRLFGNARKKKAELAANAEQWAKELETKGGLRYVILYI